MSYRVLFADFRRQPRNMVGIRFFEAARGDEKNYKMRRTPRFHGLEPASPASSRTKSAVRALDTRPEVLLRSAIWRRGLRYRVAPVGIPGKPDVVFARKRVAIFCDGDFWHGKEWETRRVKLAKGHNPEYWVAKIEANIARDRRVTAALRLDGWVVLRFWESDVLDDVQRVADAVERVLRTREKHGKPK
jgi:DNA mismatch endonuclease (patch repair protein)